MGSGHAAAAARGAGGAPDDAAGNVTAAVTQRARARARTYPHSATKRDAHYSASPFSLLLLRTRAAGSESGSAPKPSGGAASALHATTPPHTLALTISCTHRRARTYARTQPPTRSSPARLPARFARFF